MVLLFFFCFTSGTTKSFQPTIPELLNTHTENFHSNFPLTAFPASFHTHQIWSVFSTTRFWTDGIKKISHHYKELEQVVGNRKLPSPPFKQFSIFPQTILDFTSPSHTHKFWKDFERQSNGHNLHQYFIRSFQPKIITACISASREWRITTIRKLRNKKNHEAFDWQQSSNKHKRNRFKDIITFI